MLPFWTLGAVALTFPIFGFPIFGFWTFGFWMLGFWIFGLPMLGFWTLGLLISGLPMFGSVTSAFWTLGFPMLGLPILGFWMLGLLASGFKTAEALSPFEITEPPMAVICATFTVTVASGFVEVTKTLRDTDEYCGTAMSSVVNWENCRKEAEPPVGWFAIMRRTKIC